MLSYQRVFLNKYVDGSKPIALIATVLEGMNIHLPTILGFFRVAEFSLMPIWIHECMIVSYELWVTLW